MGVAPTPAQTIAWIGTIPGLAALGATNVYGMYAAQNLYPTNNITRTGYNESDLVDYNTKSVKSLNSIHYKLSSTVEASVAASWGSGTTVYTGSERYSIKNFKLSQYKAEIKGNDFYVRAYTTRENSGDSYNATALGSYLNEY